MFGWSCWCIWSLSLSTPPEKKGVRCLWMSSSVITELNEHVCMCIHIPMHTHTGWMCQKIDTKYLIIIRWVTNYTNSYSAIIPCGMCVWRTVNNWLNHEHYWLSRSDHDEMAVTLPAHWHGQLAIALMLSHMMWPWCYTVKKSIPLCIAATILLKLGTSRCLNKRISPMPT